LVPVQIKRGPWTSDPTLGVGEICMIARKERKNRVKIVKNRKKS